MEISTLIPDEICGVPTYPLIGLIVGILFAVNEAVRVKYKDYALKVTANGGTVTFDNKYIVTAVLGIVVVVATVYSVKETGIISGVPNTVESLFAVAMVGFTEGWAVIKTLNKRLDLFIKEKAVKSGATEEQAQAIADAVEFVEVPEKEEKSTSVSFEEL